MIGCSISARMSKRHSSNFASDSEERSERELGLASFENSCEMCGQKRRIGCKSLNPMNSGVQTRPRFVMSISESACLTRNQWVYGHRSPGCVELQMRPSQGENSGRFEVKVFFFGRSISFSPSGRLDYVNERERTYIDISRVPKIRLEFSTPISPCCMGLRNHSPRCYFSS